MRQALFDLLPRFEGRHPEAREALPDFRAQMALERSGVIVQDIGAADERAAGFVEGHAAAMAALDGMIAEERSEAARQLADARRMWVEDEGPAIVDALSAATAQLEARLSAQIAALLSPLVDSAMQQRMVAAFAVALRRLLDGRDGKADRAGIYVVEGPADLIAVLRAELETQPLNIDLLATDRRDLAVTVGDTTIETDTDAWMVHFNAEGAQS